MIVMHTSLEGMNGAICNWSFSEPNALPAHNDALKHYRTDGHTESPADVHVWAASTVQCYNTFEQGFWQGCGTVCLTTKPARSHILCIMEGNCAAGSASQGCRYVRQSDSIVPPG